MKKQAYSITGFCRTYGLGRSTWYVIRKNGGELPPVVRIGGRVMILREAAEKWLAERQQAA